MNYLISEEELKDVFGLGIDGQYIEYDKFIKSKQPVELLAEGKVAQGNWVGNIYVGDDDIGGRIWEKYKGKQVKLYIEVSK